MKISNETRVGIFAAIAITLLILGFNFLKGNNLFSRDKTYYAIYDRVDGLAVPNYVRAYGVNVGKVKHVELSEGAGRKVIVSFTVDKGVNVPIGTKAMLTSIDLFGTKAILLDFTTSSDNYVSGDTIPSLFVGSFTDEIQESFRPITVKVEELMGSLDTVVTTVSAIFTEETKANLQSSISSIEKTLNNLNSSSQQVDEILKSNVKRLDHIFANIDSITSTLNANHDKINSILSNLAAITDSIRRSEFTAAIIQAKDVLEEATDIMTKINSGEGSMGLLVNDDKLYNNLERATKNLDALIADMKANPGKYIKISVF